MLHFINNLKNKRFYNFIVMYIINIIFNERKVLLKIFYIEMTIQVSFPITFSMPLFFYAYEYKKSWVAYESVYLCL